MQTENMPAGITAQQIALALQYLKQQMEQNAPRPSGLLPANMIRGVNKNYQYEYRPYPKCLMPPEVTVSSRVEEARLRSKWGQPLPWPVTTQEGLATIEKYYVEQEYPKLMQPPPVIAETEEQAAAILASWRQEFGDAAIAIYPMWMHHPSQPSILVKDRAAREALGKNWYATIQEAQDAAAGVEPPKPAEPEREERERLFARASELKVKIDSRIKTPLLRQIVAQAEEKAAAKAA